MEYALFLRSFTVVAVLVPNYVHSYPSGAPVYSCLTMYPKHMGTQSQLDFSAYRVDTSTGTYTPGSSITVTVSSAKGEPFKGVILRARRTETNPDEILGTYTNLQPPNKLRHMDCQGGSMNMVTHLNNASVDSVSATWTAPNMNAGPVIFDVTVVQSFYKIYYGLHSQIINPAAGSPAITQPANISSAVNNTVGPIDWDACGDSKGCLLYPRYCTGEDCKAGVSFVVNKDEGTATFEMMVKEAKYVALGFSKDMEMGEDQTIACISVYDKVDIQLGWNHPSKFNVPDGRVPSLTKLEAAKNMDGTIMCRFTRPLKVDQQVLYTTNVTTLSVDLNEEHHLFLAWGSTYLASDVIGYHYQMPVISETKIDFFDHSNYKGSVLEPIMRAHATLMALAWMGFASLALVMARYYKEGFNDKKICGIKIWFHIHRISAIMTFVLTIIGMILVLVHTDGDLTDIPTAHTHMCLGFTVVSLVIAQVILGIIRPKPEHKIRPVFNVVHRLFGTAALVIATAALIQAYKIEIFSYEAQRFGERTVAVWAGIYVFMLVLHSGYRYLASRYSVLRARSDDYNLDKDNNEPVAVDPAPPNYIIMAIFLLFIACSIIAAIIMTVFV